MSINQYVQCSFLPSLQNRQGHTSWVLDRQPCVLPNLYFWPITYSLTTSTVNDITTIEYAFSSIWAMPWFKSLHGSTIWEESGFKYFLNMGSFYPVINAKLAWLREIYCAKLSYSSPYHHHFWTWLSLPILANESSTYPHVVPNKTSLLALQFHCTTPKVIWSIPSHKLG